MATTHISEAFNQEAGDKAVCTKAFVDYVFREGVQRQVITLNVVYANGVMETLQSPVHDMSSDPNEEARKLARGLTQPILLGAAIRAAGIAEPMVSVLPPATLAAQPPAPEPPRSTAAPMGAESTSAAADLVLLATKPESAGGTSPPVRTDPNPFIDG